jgi:ribose transport system substrate-binding protein
MVHMSHWNQKLRDLKKMVPRSRLGREAMAVPALSFWRSVALSLAACALFSCLSCNRSPSTIAVIPRNCATLLWEPMHAGAVTESRGNLLHVYWNGPTQENDVRRQIGFLQLASDRHYGGVIVAPDETLAFRSPVTQLLGKGTPVIVVDDDLELPSNIRLAYVLNDEAVGGQIAARRLSSVLHGKGNVALLGINLHLRSTQMRALSFERTLAAEAPGIHVAFREPGGTNLPYEQQTAEKVLRSSPRVDAIVALSSLSTRGSYYAKIEMGMGSEVPILGFDQDLLPPIRAGEIDSIVMQKTYQIGLTSMQEMEKLLHGESVPEKTLIAPVLLTRETLDSPVFQEQRSYVVFPWDEQ